MSGFRTLGDLAVAGQRVLLRLDLNLPMQDGRIGDATRIERAIPTIKALSEAGARIVAVSHFGRPKGARRPELSLRPVVEPLQSALRMPVAFAEDCVGPAAKACVDGLADGEVALLENLRFHPGEEANDADFAAALAENADLYVNDAFSCAHRAHASTAAVAGLRPAAAGLSMQAELQALHRALAAPDRPLVALVGGAKVSSKLAVLSNLIERVDGLIIGGGMANTFLHAQGHQIGRSLAEPDLAESAREIIAKAAARGSDILLPVDVVVAKEFRAGVDSASIDVRRVPAEMMILDIGPRSCRELAARLEATRTLVWNGPLGAYEVPPFDQGTVQVARAAARHSKAGKLTTVAGGGDTVAALRHAGVADDFSYLSTAGGAFLEWLEGKQLPGVAALER